MSHHKDFEWEGSYAFQIVGTDLHEDTLRVKSNYKDRQMPLKFILPTLCITYADMSFQNAVGGEQLEYPESQSYGPIHFSPGVSISGEKDIEKFTYIRGAQQVEIGPEKTIIAFSSFKDLVIPRLRIEPQKIVNAEIQIPRTPISIEEPLRISVIQYGDGRHTGDVNFEKRHPDWKPDPQKPFYDLSLCVIDGITLQPIPQATLDIFCWDKNASTPYGKGRFVLDNRQVTDEKGCIHIPGRPSGKLEAYLVRIAGRRSVPRVYRPSAGQKVRTHLRSWPLKKDLISYVWKEEDTLEKLAQFTGTTPGKILSLNRLKNPKELRPGIRIHLPCFTATYRMEPWDKYDWVGQTFGYENAKGLAQINGYKSIDSLIKAGLDIKLPDWRFFYAPKKRTLEMIDQQFGLQKGSTISVGRAYHPEPRMPLPGEMIAVPMPAFAEKWSKHFYKTIADDQ